LGARHTFEDVHALVVELHGRDIAADGAGVQGGIDNAFVEFEKALTLLRDPGHGDRLHHGVPHLLSG